MPQATYSIKTFADLRMYIAADMFRYMTSTSAKAFLRAWYIAGFRYTFLYALLSLLQPQIMASAQYCPK